MEYPVWQLQFMNSGLMVAVIAVIHVILAHIAVGGGFLLVWAERHARASGSKPALDAVKRATLRFLLLTMVAGGLTGVGIWFVITVASPRATSMLARNFVWAFATEWVFFLGEIVALLIYHYRFDRMPARAHMTVGWIYALFGWLSLFVITGITSFMLTPGAWASMADLRAGFFNPTFWPQIGLRTGLSLVLAGAFGLATFLDSQDGQARIDLSRLSGRFVVLGALLTALSAWAFTQALPPSQAAMLLRKTQDIAVPTWVFLAVTPILILAGLMLAKRASARPAWGLVAGVFVLGMLQLGSFEWVRETARRPYLLHSQLYSSQITPKEAQDLATDGFLARARWVSTRTITPKTELDAGRELFVHQCQPCHGARGPMLKAGSVMAGWPVLGMDALIAEFGRPRGLHEYMPPFAGTPQERLALARYVVAVQQDAAGLVQAAK